MKKCYGMVYTFQTLDTFNYKISYGTVKCILFIFEAPRYKFQCLIQYWTFYQCWLRWNLEAAKRRCGAAYRDSESEEEKHESANDLPCDVPETMW